MNNIFYVYVHRKLTNNHIFYVGKGCGYRSHDKTGRNDYWNKIINKHGFSVEIVLKNLTESQAFNLEIELIKFYGRDRLCNLTDGGEGVSGAVFSESRILKIKEKSIKQWSDPINRLNQSIRIKDAFKNNLDYRKKHSESQKLRFSKPEEKLKLYNSIKSYYSIPENKAAHKLRQQKLSKNIDFINKQIQSGLNLYKNEAYAEKMRIIRKNSKNVKKIICINTGKIFQCMNDAANELGISQGNISHVLKGNRKSVRGYFFKYYIQE